MGHRRFGINSVQEERGVEVDQDDIHNFKLTQGTGAINLIESGYTAFTSNIIIIEFCWGRADTDTPQMNSIRTSTHSVHTCRYIY